MNEVNATILSLQARITKLEELLTPIAKAKIYNPSQSTKPDTFRTINVKFQDLENIRLALEQDTAHED